MSIQPGSRLGPYEIAEPLGSGGMGEVYRARDSRLGRSVAIKIIQPDVASDRERLARFQREARLASSLNHPNIVTIYEFVSENGTSFIAMELVAGQSLRALMRESAIAVKDVIGIATQVAAGLAAAHRAGIIHRDLKPENIMITPQGVAKVLDFGLAKTSESARSDPNAPTDELLTHGHHVVGTAAYMSPEQTRGVPLDFRSDQFSFGVILQEMLTRRHPFARENSMDTLVAIGRDDAPPLGSDVPDVLRWIVERCLEKNPGRRYGSTDDLVADLGRAGERPVHRPVAGARPNWLPWAVAIAALAVAGVVVVRDRQPAPPKVPTYAVLDLPEIAIPRSPVNNPVAIDPGGRRVLIAGQQAAGYQLFLRDLSETTTTPLAGTEGGYAPTWSPDGKRAAFFSNGKLKTVSVSGGAPDVLCDAFSEAGIAWSEGGTIVFGQVNHPDGPGLFKIEDKGGSPVRLSRPDQKRGEFIHLWPEFLPDGRHFFYIAFASDVNAPTSDLSLMVGSIDGDAPKKVGPAFSRVVYRNGRVYYVRDAALLSQPFDLDGLRFTGEPELIAKNVEYVRDSANAGFSVAANGTIVYRSPRADARLLLLDAGGRQLADLGRAQFNSGRIAADGTRFVVSIVDPKLGLADLWMYDLGGHAPSRVTFETWDERAPVWSRDNRSIFYAADIKGPPDVYRLDLDRSRREPVITDPRRQDPLDVSPDGKLLLYQDFSRERGYDIRSLRLEAGAKSEPVVATPFNENDARFSPDGKWISFTSDLSGRSEVYVVAFPVRGTPIRVSASGGSVARWSADGRELSYLAPPGDLTAVTVTPKGESIEVGQPRFLFRLTDGIRSFEVTRDHRYVVITDEIDPAPPVQLVLR